MIPTVVDAIDPVRDVPRRSVGVDRFVIPQQVGAHLPAGQVNRRFGGGDVCPVLRQDGRMYHPFARDGDFLDQLPPSLCHLRRLQDEERPLGIARDPDISVRRPHHGIGTILVTERRMSGEEPDALDAVVDAADPTDVEVETFVVTVNQRRTDRRLEVGRDRDLVAVFEMFHRDPEGLKAQRDLDDVVELACGDERPVVLIRVTFCLGALIRPAHGGSQEFSPCQSKSFQKGTAPVGRIEYPTVKLPSCQDVKVRVNLPKCFLSNDGFYEYPLYWRWICGRVLGRGGS